MANDPVYVVYLIEYKVGRQRIFRPATHHGVFATKRDANAKIRELQSATKSYSYRAKDYWAKRPW